MNEYEVRHDRSGLIANSLRFAASASTGGVVPLSKIVTALAIGDKTKMVSSEAVMSLADNIDSGKCDDVGESDEFKCSRCGYSLNYWASAARTGGILDDSTDDWGGICFCPQCGAHISRIGKYRL